MERDTQHLLLYLHSYSLKTYKLLTLEILPSYYASSLLVLTHDFLFLFVSYSSLLTKSLYLVTAEIAKNNGCGAKRQGAARKGTAHLADKILSLRSAKYNTWILRTVSSKDK